MAPKTDGGSSSPRPSILLIRPPVLLSLEYMVLWQKAGGNWDGWLRYRYGLVLYAVHDAIEAKRNSAVPVGLNSLYCWLTFLFELNTQVAMILYLVVARPYQGWKLQGLEVTAHALETVIFVIAMALMQVRVAE